ncbi:MAG TPA: polyhydroxyalkanoic acid system family protein [Thermoanaerobaculia bacterium]|nr:polyhydroxyalkanoic acid system family protein [Thermoanaerobaculia bacterium]
MRIAIPHNTIRQDARARVEMKVGGMLSQFGGRADEIEHEWTGDTLRFKGKARGFSVSGTLEVTDSEVVIDGKLPLIAMAFEPRIREAVKREAETIFRTA